MFNSRVWSQSVTRCLELPQHVVYFFIMLLMVRDGRFLYACYIGYHLYNFTIYLLLMLACVYSSISHVCHVKVSLPCLVHCCVICVHELRGVCPQCGDVTQAIYFRCHLVICILRDNLLH